MTHEFEKEYLGGFEDMHDYRACRALRQYENGLTHTYAKMKEIAIRNHTTIDDMKQHWECIK